MTKSLLVLAMLVASPGFGLAQPSVQQSHIEANVPEPSQFRLLLNRDVLAYFREHGSPTATRVEVKLLRDAPTQSGVAYPKYYAWVRVFASEQVLQQGAVRVAAIDKVRFDITNFVSQSQATGDRGAVEKVFPPPLVADIVARAGTPR